MTYRMSYCVPVFSYMDPGDEAVSATSTSPDGVRNIPYICFPTFIKDTDVVRIRVGWESSSGRGIKVWFTDPGDASPTFGGTTGSYVLHAIELASTSTNYAQFPVSEASFSAGVTCVDTTNFNETFGAHIRGNKGVSCWIGTAASGSGTAKYSALDIWIEGGAR